MNTVICNSQKGIWRVLSQPTYLQFCECQKYPKCFNENYLFTDNEKAVFALIENKVHINAAVDNGRTALTAATAASNLKSQNKKHRIRNYNKANFLM